MTEIADERITCPFDHNDPNFRHDFRSTFAELRATAPIVWSESHGGYWVASTYDVVREIARDSETFTVAPGPDRTGGLRIPTSPGLKTRPLFVPGETDGEEHDDYRLALNPHFSRARVAELQPLIDRHVGAAFDRVLASGAPVDVVRELVEPILSGVASEHLGLELDDPPTFFRTMHRMISTSGGADFEHTKRTFESSWSVLEGVVGDRRSDPRDDVISALLANEAPAFTDEQVEMMVLNVILGAFHTTSSLMTQVLIHLEDDVELRELLRSNPDDVPKAIDEFLRLKAVAIAIARTATRDIEIGGVHIAQGDRVLIALASANHDPDRYADPTTFDLVRGSRQHLGMGVGTHFCLGAWLATSMIAPTVRTMLDRIDHFHFDLDRLELAPEISTAFAIEHAPATVVFSVAAG